MKESGFEIAGPIGPRNSKSQSQREKSDGDGFGLDFISPDSKEELLKIISGLPSEIKSRLRLEPERMTLRKHIRNWAWTVESMSDEAG